MSVSEEIASIKVRALAAAARGAKALKHAEHSLAEAPELFGALKLKVAALAPKLAALPVPSF